jgi:catechol 2,3-dioxygenase-like lactoylglutathione lyase family enzyme
VDSSREGRTTALAIGKKRGSRKATVRYLVNDVDEAVAFYQEALGFSLRARPASVIAMIERGDLLLWIAGPQTSAAKAMPDGCKPEPGGWNRIVIEVDDIESTVAALRSRGTILRNEPFPGARGTQVLIEDPSGNPIEIFQPAENAPG